MMKNKILFLVMFLGIALFSSCNDDDKDPFKNYSVDYNADKLDLKLNGKTFTGASVLFSSTNKENAVISLKGVIPGESSLEIRDLVVTELGGNDYSFTGENKNNDRTVSVEGSVKSGVLSLGTTFKITSKVVGKWMMAEMKMNQDDMSIISSPLYLNIDTDLDSIALPLLMFSGNYNPDNTPIYDKEWKLSMENDIENGAPGFPVLIQNIFGGLIPGLLQSIELKNDGNLIATYFPLTGLMSEEGSEGPLVTGEGLVRYNVKDGEMYLLIDIASLIGDVASAANISRENNSGNGIMDMLTSGIPLKLIVEESKLRAYVDKDMMMPFMSFAGLAKDAVKDMEPMNVMIGEVTSAALQKFIDDIVNLVTNAKTIELGLDLVPYVETPAPAASMVMPQAVEKMMQKFAK